MSELTISITFEEENLTFTWDIQDFFKRIFPKLEPEDRQNMFDVFRKMADEARKKADKNKEMEAYAKKMEMIFIMAEEAITKCTSTDECISTDEELNKLLGGLTIAQGGVLPNIQAVLLPKKTSEK